MHPLTRYYINQAGGGGSSGGVGPIYSLLPYIQRGHGIGDYLGPLFRAIKPLSFSGAKAAGKALGRAALRTGGKILSEIADNPQMNYKDIISKNVQESLQNMRSTMMGGGRKPKRRAPSRTKRPAAKRRNHASSTRGKPKEKPKRRRVLNVGLHLLKKDICLTVMAGEPSYLGTEFDLFARKAKQDSLNTTETIYKPIAC